MWFPDEYEDDYDYDYEEEDENLTVVYPDTTQTFSFFTEDTPTRAPTRPPKRRPQTRRPTRPQTRRPLLGLVGQEPRTTTQRTTTTERSTFKPFSFSFKDIQTTRPPRVEIEEITEPTPIDYDPEDEFYDASYEEDEDYYDEEYEDEYYDEEEYEDDNVDEGFRIQNQPIRWVHNTVYV